MKTPRQKKQPKVKTPRQKKPKKVTVFNKVDEFNKGEINEVMYAKISDKFETIKHKFETALKGLKGMLDMENPHRPTIDNSLRQNFGYHLLGISGKDIKLYSLEAFNLKKLKAEKITDEKIIADHFFGCLCFTNIMLIDLINCNYDINYMVNEWLRKHLYLWVVIRVTKKEHEIITKKAAKFHNQENPNYKLEYNLKLKREHYKGVSDIGFLIKE